MIEKRSSNASLVGMPMDRFAWDPLWQDNSETDDSMDEQLPAVWERAPTQSVKRDAGFLGPMRQSSHPG